MKQFLRSLCTLLLLMMWCSVGFAAAGDNFTLVTAESELKAGDIIIIVNQKEKKALSTNQKKNNRGATLVTISGNNVTSSDETQEITLEGASGAWYFNVGNGYLYADGNDKNYLRTKIGGKNGDYSKAAIVITSTNTTITFQGDNSNKKLQYNSQSNLFSCYSSDKEAVAIYKKAATKTLTSLAISGEPTKKAYNAGEAFDPTGLVVTGTYDDASTATITDGITWTKTPATLTVGTTSCSITATVNGVTSPAYNVTGLTVTKTTAIVFDFTANPNAWGITPKSSNGKNGSNVVAGKELKVSGVMMTATNGSRYGTCLYGTTSVTLNVYNGGSITFTAPEGYNISEIKFDNSKANFTTKEGNYANGIWVGNAHAVKFSNNDNKIAIKTATIKLVATFQTLDESKDNTETISNNNGKTIDIKLTRTLVADKWNTFCVPFETEIAGTALEGATVKAVGTIEGNVINLVDAAKIEAGVPYLVKPTSGNIENPTFKSVTISVTTPVGKGNDDYKFVGTYSPKNISKDEFGTIWGVTAEGKLAKINANTTMKGLRAYFVFPTTTAAAKLNFDGETTGINNIETNAAVNGKVYNLNGQYIGNSLNGLKKGIYVVNGKKVIK